LGIEVEFSGKDESERGVIIDVDEERAAELGLNREALKFGQTVVKVDQKYFRPTEVDLLIGDSTKAREKLGWKPKFDLRELVSDMIQSDLHQVKKDDYLKKGGFTTLNYFE
jgi:GDPmannose 4,6-dehydratase